MADARFNEFARYAELVAHDDAQWLDPGAALPSGTAWPAADVVPVCGTERLVKVADNGRPFTVGEERWVLFIPALGALNGWSHYPATILRSAFAHCRLRAAERASSKRPNDSWLRVEVIDVAPFADLERRFPGRSIAGLATWQLSTGTLTRHEDWELWFAPHDDAGYWLLARLRQDEAHVLAAGEWVYGITWSAVAWGGHLVMPAAAWRQICQRG
jgi:hypothetical protein